MAENIKKLTNLKVALIHWAAQVLGRHRDSEESATSWVNELCHMSRASPQALQEMHLAVVHVNTPTSVSLEITWVFTQSSPQQTPATTSTGSRHSALLRMKTYAGYGGSVQRL